MIISKIIGGLGNQLFQYAAGRCLSIHHNTELKLDISGFEAYKLRNFDLDAFQVVYNKATTNEIDFFCKRNLLKKIHDRFGPYSKRTYLRESYFHYNKNFLKYPANIYLKGYWQSQKYFSPIIDTVRRELIFKEGVISKVISFAKEMSGMETISLHIRRGDFTNKETLTIHGVLPQQYYNSAIQLITLRHPSAKLLVFSDDTNWAKKNLHYPNLLFVSNEISQTHFEDLYLMSRCKHNIIANSSFSWWGAWLNNNPDKIVIAPKNWFNKGPKDTYDLYPEGWIRL